MVMDFQTIVIVTMLTNKNSDQKLKFAQNSLKFTIYGKFIC